MNPKRRKRISIAAWAGLIALGLLILPAGLMFTTPAHAEEQKQEEKKWLKEKKPAPPHKAQPAPPHRVQPPPPAVVAPGAREYGERRDEEMERAESLRPANMNQADEKYRRLRDSYLKLRDENAVLRRQNLELQERQRETQWR